MGMLQVHITSRGHQSIQSGLIEQIAYTMCITHTAKEPITKPCSGSGLPARIFFRYPNFSQGLVTGFDDGPDSRRAATHRILIPFSDPAEWADMLIRARGADEFLRRREEVKSWLSIQLLLPLILSGVYPPVSTPVTTDPAYSPLDLPLTGPAPAAT